LDSDVEALVGADLDAIRTATAALLAEKSPLGRVRELAEQGGGFDADVLSAGAALRWFCGDIQAAAAVGNERGRLLQPGPYVPMQVVVSAVASPAGSAHHEVLSALRTGADLATWAAFTPTGAWNPSGGVRAASAGRGSVRLDGVCGLVPDAGLVTWLLVAAGEGRDVSQFLVRRDTPGVSTIRLESLDLTRTLWEVRFDGVEVETSYRLGPAGEAGPQLDAQLDLAVAMSLSETVGALVELFDRTVAYARQRTAFGRPIGSFQAIKHLLADSSRLVETSKAVTAAAVRGVTAATRPQLGDAGPDVTRDEDRASELVSMAKSYVSTASVELAHACWQTFGGVAYKWEHDFHLYLRRLTSDAALYGDAAWHNERLCALNEF
jgi:alkylation response protein AidB-like acyl-CoA dehydrogenase